MRLTYSFKREHDTGEVRVALKRRFPQFLYVIERAGDNRSFTVRIPHPILDSEKTEVLNILRDLDKTDEDWAQECDETYDPAADKLRSMTVEKIHNHFEDRRVKINASNLTAAQKGLLVGMCDDDERLARVLLFALRHRGF